MATAAAIAAMKPSQKAYEKGRAARAGLSLDEWIARKMPHDRLATLIDSMIKACGEHEAYLDKLGTSGYLEADRKLLDLTRRRIASVDALKSALALRPR